MSDLLLKISCHPFWLFLSYPYLAENLFILYIPLTCLILNLVHYLASFALDVLYLFFISLFHDLGSQGKNISSDTSSRGCFHLSFS